MADRRGAPKALLRNNHRSTRRALVFADSGIRRLQTPCEPRRV